MKDALSLGGAKLALLCWLMLAAEYQATEPDLTPLVSFKSIAGATSEGGGDFAIEGDLDLGFEWRPSSNVRMLANVELRDRFSNEGFSDINSDLGVLSGVADGVSNGPLHRLEKLWLRWDFSPGVSALQVGRLHFEDHVLDNALSSKSAIAFANEAFSAKPAIAFPRDAFGLVLQHEVAPG